MMLHTKRYLFNAPPVHSGDNYSLGVYPLRYQGDTIPYPVTTYNNVVGALQGPHIRSKTHSLLQHGEIPPLYGVYLSISK